MTDFTHCVVEKGMFPDTRSPQISAVSPNSTYFAMFSPEPYSLIRVFNVHTDELILERFIPRTIDQLAFSPDSSTLLTHMSDDDEIKLFNVNKKFDNISDFCYVANDTKIAFSTDGKYLVYTDKKDKIKTMKVVSQSHDKICNKYATSVKKIMYSSRHDVPAYCCTNSGNIFSLFWKVNDLYEKRECIMIGSIVDYEMDDETNKIILCTVCEKTNIYKIITVTYPWLDQRPLDKLSETISTVLVPKNFIFLSKNTGYVLGENLVLYDVVPVQNKATSIKASIVDVKNTPLVFFTTPTSNIELHLCKTLNIDIRYDDIFEIGGVKYCMHADFEHDRRKPYELVLPTGTEVIVFGTRMALMSDTKIHTSRQVSVVLKAGTKIHHCELPITSKLERDCVVFI